MSLNLRLLISYRIPLVLSLLALAAGNHLPRANADPDAPAGAADLEPVYKSQDPAFAKFVDGDLIAEALATQDASQLADAALLIAEGERILRRPHKGLSAERLTVVAIRLASDKRDQETLQRLASALKEGPNANLAATAEIALKAAQGTRAAEEPAPLDGADEATVTRFEAFVEGIQTVKALGHAGGLDDIATDVKGAGFNEKQQAYLVKAIKKARESLPENPDPEVEALVQLASGSRVSTSNNKASVQSSVRSGWRGVIFAKEFDHAQEAVMIAAMVGTGGSAAAAWIPPWVAEAVKALSSLNDARNIILQVIKQRKAIVRGGRTVDCGIATYNWSATQVVKVGPIKKTISSSLPNTFQPYIRWR